MVLKNEPRNRRVECAEDKMTEVPCLTLGNDENYVGLANPTLGLCDVESDDSANKDDARQDINEDEFESEYNEDYVGISSSNEE